MKELDVNGDGKLSKQEFEELIKVVMTILDEESSGEDKAKLADKPPASSASAAEQV